MPKKTKKKKLLALYHKKIRLLENKQATVPATVSSMVPKKPDSVLAPVANQETKISPLNQYFFSDLKKSLILITVIIGLEISLYFAKLIK